MFNLSSASDLNLDKAIILSSEKGLKLWIIQLLFVQETIES